MQKVMSGVKSRRRRKPRKRYIVIVVEVKCHSVPTFPAMETPSQIVCHVLECVLSHSSLYLGDYLVVIVQVRMLHSLWNDDN